MARLQKVCKKLSPQPKPEKSLPTNDEFLSPSSSTVTPSSTTIPSTISIPSSMTYFVDASIAPVTTISPPTTTVISYIEDHTVRNSFGNVLDVSNPSKTAGIPLFPAEVCTPQVPMMAATISRFLFGIVPPQVRLPSVASPFATPIKTSTTILATPSSDPNTTERGNVN